MDDASYRGTPPAAAVLAIAGAALAVGLLFLSWYIVDPAGVMWVAANAPLDQTPEQLAAAAGGVDDASTLIAAGVQDLQQGWDLETSSWLAFRIGGAALAVAAAMQMIRQGVSGPFQRISFLIAGLVFLAAPAIRLTNTLGPKQSAMLEVTPAMYGTFVAGGMMIVALVLADRWTPDAAAVRTAAQPLTPAPSPTPEYPAVQADPRTAGSTPPPFPS